MYLEFLSTVVVVYLMVEHKNMSFSHYHYGRFQNLLNYGSIQIGSLNGRYIGLEWALGNVQIMCARSGY